MRQLARQREIDLEQTVTDISDRTPPGLVAQALGQFICRRRVHRVDAAEHRTHRLGVLLVVLLLLLRLAFPVALLLGDLSRDAGALLEIVVFARLLDELVGSIGLTSHVGHLAQRKQVDLTFVGKGERAVLAQVERRIELAGLQEAAGQRQAGKCGH